MTKLMFGVAVAALLYPVLGYSNPTDGCMDREVPVANYSFYAEAGPAFPEEDLVRIDVQAQVCVNQITPPSRPNPDEAAMVTFYLDGQFSDGEYRGDSFTELPPQTDDM